MKEAQGNKNSQISFRLEDELKRQWKSKLGAEGGDQTNVLVAFVKQYVAGSAGVAEPAAPSNRSKSARWHELLDIVLDRGTKRQREWLTGNLQTFAEAIELREEIAELKASATARRKSG